MKEKLGSNQLIWCLLKATDEHIISDQIRVQWELNVSEPTKTNPTPRIYDSKLWDDIVQKRLPLEHEFPESLFLEDVSKPNASVIIQRKDILSVEKTILWLRTDSKVSLTDNFLGLDSQLKENVITLANRFEDSRSTYEDRLGIKEELRSIFNYPYLWTSPEQS